MGIINRMLKMNNKLKFNNYMLIAEKMAKKQAMQQYILNKKGSQSFEEFIKNFDFGKDAEIPVGCVIVDDKTGKVLAKSCNQTRQKNNPLYHAEMICINRALSKLKINRLTGCSLYVTMEPCMMCFGAIKLARINKIYIGATSTKHIVGKIHKK